MRTLLGVFMAIVVSGDDNHDVKGFLDGSVLLPCNCSGINLSMGLQWEMETPKKMLLFKYHKNPPDNDSYKGRVKIFLPEMSGNCSLLLTNVTAGDQGTYRCIFHREERYKQYFVNLNVSGRYTVCQDPARNLSGDSSVKVFQCNATGPYEEAEIQWKSNGQLLRNSSKTNITNTRTHRAPTGPYHFTSSLSTKVSMTPELTCDVKAKGISTDVSYNCVPVAAPIEDRPQDVMIFFIIIPIVVVLLMLSLTLWRWKFSQRSPTARQVEAGNSFY